MDRLPDRYFDDAYAADGDPWKLADRWYDARKYAITMAMLPEPRYRHAFEPGCSVGVLTAQLVGRCDRVTSIDVSAAALDATRARTAGADNLELLLASMDTAWPATPFDLVVVSEVAYYLSARTVRAVFDRECARLAPGATVVAAHWRHPVADYPLSGDEANELIGATAGLNRLARYRDDDVVIDVLVNGRADSVATRGAVPGASRRS